MKSEIQDLEGTQQKCQGGDVSLLQELFDKIPSGILGGDQAGKAQELQAHPTAHQMQNSRISPWQPEEWQQHLMDVQKQSLSDTGMA
jgi:hypothetical protein